MYICPVLIGARSGDEEAGAGDEDNPTTGISPIGELANCPFANPRRCSSSRLFRSSSFRAFSRSFLLAYFALFNSRSRSFLNWSLLFTASTLLASFAFFLHRVQTNSYSGYVPSGTSFRFNSSSLSRDSGRQSTCCQISHFSQATVYPPSSYDIRPVEEATYVISAMFPTDTVKEPGLFCCNRLRLWFDRTTLRIQSLLSGSLLRLWCR